MGAVIVTLGQVFLSGIQAFFLWVVQWFFMKLLFLTAVFVIVDFFWPILIGLFPSYLTDASEIQQLFGVFPSWIMYLAYWTAFSDFGFELVISAMIVRFTIRRLPLIG
ncbi:hypothetical protein [Beggiatoa leptomitoformis]|uniref:DUF2523 domain-containing protein n=1 Tax=Beggiatoa leptomitoformis TaxID=288004 RepID=A0A2N9YCU7_9GAMM|nr:hypothetical protein [Beggiatoa leptomitoformis]ALG66430.1 hypothetical protein AL038_00085 [Beggiatoa leptomitoformis]AUI68293.1 hypothetical protein BLE401_05985 [Beggiatoa leptomitoformis]